VAVMQNEQKIYTEILVVIVMRSRMLAYSSFTFGLCIKNKWEYMEVFMIKSIQMMNHNVDVQFNVEARLVTKRSVFL
jgi:hypothetical protein